MVTTLVLAVTPPGTREVLAEATARGMAAAMQAHEEKKNEEKKQMREECKSLPKDTMGHFRLFPPRSRCTSRPSFL